MRPRGAFLLDERLHLRLLLLAVRVVLPLPLASLFPAHLGHGLYRIGAQMRGESYEEFMATRNEPGAV